MKRRNFFKKRESHRYQKRAFRNPHQRNTSNGIWKFIAIPVVLLCVLCWGVFFLFSSNRFEITETTIVGLATIPEESIHQIIDDSLATKRWIFFRSSNRFLFRPQDLEESLQQSFAFALISIKVEKQHLTLTLEEKASHILWQTADVRYLVDREGVIIRRIAQEELFENLPLFKDLNHEQVLIGDMVLTSQELETIEQFHAGLAQQEITVMQTNIDRLAGKWMSVATDVGYQILFDPSSDIKEQLIRLEAVLRERVSDPSRLQYIDLRFGDHVYIK